MKKDYLEWHGRQWRVQVKVPLKARQILKKHRLVVPLHTDSLAEANRKKYRVVDELKRQIEKALAEVSMRERRGHDPLIEQAFEWRADIQNEIRLAPADEDGRYETLLPDLLAERSEELERQVGVARASTFHKTALGLITPLGSFVSSWLAERPDMKVRQQLDYQRAVRKFGAWLGEAGVEASIEAVTRKIAGRYISEGMVAAGGHWKTINKDISALSGYWKWLLKRGHVESNVWSGQSLPKAKALTEDDATKRPFTDREVLTLLTGIDKPLLADALRIGALTGMRVEEIARLKVADCAGDLIRVRKAKTRAGIRDVPSHPDLKEILQRRCVGKEATAYLFHELTDPSPGSAMERGQPITKGFMRERRALGVDERIEGRRQSRIDFHSLRRWFIMKARDALHAGATGYDPWTIADVVGHDRESTGLAMTMGRYPGRAPVAAMRSCVEAVTLPSTLPE